MLTLLAQSSVKLTATDTFPAGYGFLAAHRATYFIEVAFSRIHEHIAAKRAVPEFRPHLGFLLSQMHFCAGGLETRPTQLGYSYNYTLVDASYG